MATIKDVAKRANVSTTTVSHVINKTRFVAEETRNAVWAAIKELHYSPSAVARSLKVNHTKSIGLLATSSEAAYFAEIIEAVEKNCFQKGYTLILGNAWNSLEKQQAYLSMMAQKRVDGLLVMCSEYPESLLSMLEEYRHIPMVVMDWGEAKADFTDTVIDNAFEGGYMAGRYLVERGHREIGVIPCPMERNTGAGRLAGFMKAMEEALIKVPDNWIVGAISSLSPAIAPCSKFCRNRIVRPLSSAVAILWRWVRCAPLTKWVCAYHRMSHSSATTTCATPASSRRP